MSLKFQLAHLRSQLCVTLPYPETKFTSQTVIVTGSNVGMGFEAAQHFVRLDAARVILAVRSLPRGQAAAKTIEELTGRKGIVEVWELDLLSYQSVQAFASRVNALLDRLDVFIGNAAKYTWKFEVAEQDESTITVNVVSTMLLAVLVLPKLRETSVKLQKDTILSMTGSFMHFEATLPERMSPKIFDALRDKNKARMNHRSVDPSND